MTDTTAIADTLESDVFVARLMRDAAAGLRKQGRKLDSSTRRYPDTQAELIAAKAQALYRAADEIDRAADRAASLVTCRMPSSWPASGSRSACGSTEWGVLWADEPEVTPYRDEARARSTVQAQFASRGKHGQVMSREVRVSAWSAAPSPPTPTPEETLQ